MTALPLPPDPTPEEVDATEAMADMLGQLADFVAALPLTPEQRRKVNSGTRSLASARENIETIRAHQRGGGQETGGGSG